MWNSWEHFIGNYAMKLASFSCDSGKLQCRQTVRCYFKFTPAQRQNLLSTTNDSVVYDIFLYLFTEHSLLWRSVTLLLSLSFCYLFTKHSSVLSGTLLYRCWMRKWFIVIWNLYCAKTILTCTVFYCVACYVRVWRLNLWLCQFEWINGIAGRRWNVFSQQFMAEAFSSIIIWNWILKDIL